MAAESVVAPPETETPPISKTKLKKLERDQKWEVNREVRKALRKTKNKEKKLRKRAARDDAVSAALLERTAVATGNAINGKSKTKRPSSFVQLPITFVLDCGFDDLMIDKERKSLSSQVTRCYSDNHRALYQAHLTVSSFGGQLKERFDGLLAGNHLSWRNVRFLGEDFVEAATQAKTWMEGPHGGKLEGAFQRSGSNSSVSSGGSETGEVVYLTSDSPETLTELRPYSTYIIGGLVDKNRYKGICYKRAMDLGFRTAKLPIGDYMKMASRFVLTTNHVNEIMLRWLELRDWGKAFEEVIPKRKGGVFKAGAETGGEKSGGGREEDDEGEIDDCDVQEDRSEQDVAEGDCEAGIGLNPAAKEQALDMDSSEKVWAKEASLISEHAEEKGDK